MDIGIPFIFSNWYWLVAENNKYWSSKINAYTDIPDLGNLTNIDTEKNLSDVLAIYNLPGPIPIVPIFVSNYQGRMALQTAGLFSEVNSAIQQLGPSSGEYTAWEYADNFYRDSPFIISISQQLGLTSDQIDQLFIAASKIQ